MSSLAPDFWLTQQLGKPAFRVAASVGDLMNEELPQNAAFVYARVDAGDFEGLAHLQKLGFRVIDCNLTLERPVEEGSPQVYASGSPFSVRFARAADEYDVRTLASAAFEHNRFHRDPCIPNDVAARIKAEWAGNYFCGRRGDWLVVAEDAGGIGGFLQILSAYDEGIVIDLIAVSSRCRQQGIARSMIAYAYQNCLGRRSNMIVGTQLSNIASIQLYYKMGFRFHRAAYYLHKHT